MQTPKVYVICDQKCLYEGMTKEQILAAITQAVNEGTIGDCDTGFIQTVKTINGLPLRFFVGEQHEYDALTDEEKENLFAIITNDTTFDGINECIEQLRDELQDLTDSLKDVLEGGTIVAKKAECDENGENIAATYARKDEQTFYNKYFGSRLITKDVTIALDDLPDGKTVDDIAGITLAAAVTFSVSGVDYEFTDVIFRGQKEGHGDRTDGYLKNMLSLDAISRRTTANAQENSHCLFFTNIYITLGSPEEGKMQIKFDGADFTSFICKNTNTPTVYASTMSDMAIRLFSAYYWFA